MRVGIRPIVLLLYLSGQNEMSANKTKTFGDIWRQNEDFVGGATC